MGLRPIISTSSEPQWAQKWPDKNEGIRQCNNNNNNSNNNNNNKAHQKAIGHIVYRSISIS